MRPFSLENRRDYFIIAYEYLNWECQEDRGSLLSLMCNDRTRSNGHRLAPSKYQETLICCVGNGELAPTVESSFLEILKTWLNVFLTTSCRWTCSKGLDQVISRGPFQALPFCDFVILWHSECNELWILEIFLYAVTSLTLAKGPTSLNIHAMGVRSLSWEAGDKKKTLTQERLKTFLVVNDPDLGRGIETRWSFWSFSIKAILWFCDFLREWYLSVC